MIIDTYHQGVMKFRKRPTRVEAMHFLASNAEQVAQWCSGVIFTAADGGMMLSIPVKEGMVQAKFGDWIIKDASNKFHAIEDAQFYVEYERVEV